MSIHPDDWPRVRAIFEHALTLPLSARQAYLIDSCSGSEGLRREVDRMLASHDHASGFLENPADVTATGLTVATTLESIQIGPYQLGARCDAGTAGSQRAVQVT